MPFTVTNVLFLEVNIHINLCICHAYSNVFIQSTPKKFNQFFLFVRDKILTHAKAKTGSRNKPDQFIAGQNLSSFRRFVFSELHLIDCANEMKMNGICYLPSIYTLSYYRMNNTPITKKNDETYTEE